MNFGNAKTKYQMAWEMDFNHFRNLSWIYIYEALSKLELKSYYKEFVESLN